MPLRPMQDLVLTKAVVEAPEVLKFVKRKSVLKVRAPPVIDGWMDGCRAPPRNNALWLHEGGGMRMRMSVPRMCA